MTGPLRHLTAAAAAMGEGNHAMRVTINREDELGRLADAFNHMAAQIQDQIRARAASEAQFRHSQKMEAVGRLAGGVAHDFNNLLTAIMSYAELIRSDLPAGDKSIPDVDEIVRAAKQAHGLTRQLLAFSRQQVLQPVKLSPNVVVTEVGRMLQRLIGEDIELVTDLDPRIGKVRADPGQIEQVLMNLAVNARDAMRGGGKLTISSSNVELDEASGLLHGVPAGGYVMLTISDTGVGMNAETQARIFEPFYTTKEEGTGLGLATVYGIVTQAGGHVRVYSEPGSGSTFRIYLPRLPDESAARESAKAVAPPTQGSETILLVEDDAAVRTVTAEALERHGYKVLAAHTADEAIALAGRRRGPLDLVMTDVVMPQMNGPTLVSRLRQVRPGLKLLYMSGYPGEAVLQDGLLDPGIPFLEKPFTMSALAGKVREALDTVR
jgi:signal transduction histidine kinase/CheY-like chemotaxis protein